VYNPGKITKYGILVWMVCESSTGYICNLQIDDGKCGTLKQWVVYLSLMKGRVTTYIKTIITILSINGMNYYIN